MSSRSRQETIADLAAEVRLYATAKRYQDRYLRAQYLARTTPAWRPFVKLRYARQARVLREIYAAFSFAAHHSPKNDGPDPLDGPGIYRQVAGS
jgi:hypothetical protein